MEDTSSCGTKVMVEVLKVSSRSNPNSVAGALAGVVRHAGVAEIQVVGAGALNQAIKAVAIARGYLTPSGVDLVCVPTFADIKIGGEGRTAIRLLCDDRRRPGSEYLRHAVTVDLTDLSAEAPSEPLDIEAVDVPRPPDTPDGHPSGLGGRL